MFKLSVDLNQIWSQTLATGSPVGPKINDEHSCPTFTEWPRGAVKPSLCFKLWHLVTFGQNIIFQRYRDFPLWLLVSLPNKINRQCASACTGQANKNKHVYAIAFLGAKHIPSSNDQGRENQVKLTVKRKKCQSRSDSALFEYDRLFT